MRTRLSLCASIILLASASAHADVRLPEALGDHAVLQQDADVTLWGWANVGEKVVIEASWGVTLTVVADERGTWRAQVRTPVAQPLAKGLHPEHITFTAPGENRVQMRDVLIGEVWLCSGQSNMAMTLGPDAPPGNNNWYGEPAWNQDAAQAERPGLRLFNVEKTAASTPQADCKGVIPDHLLAVPDAQGLLSEVERGWRPCTRATAEHFSAVAYYFAAALQERLGVPIGLITSDVGGTRIDSWVSLEALQALPAFADARSAATRSASAALYNAMIAPLTPLRLRGCIWYQGESNHGMSSAEYASVFTALIGDWRRRFAQDGMPFYFVQLAPFACNDDPRSGDLRAGQAAVLALPHTGMAVINDISDPANIHPTGKREVGRRLAWQALRKTYGCADVVADGPVPRTVARAGAALRVAFTTIGALAARDGKDLTCFTIAGADGHFVPATATLAGDEVVVSSPQVPAPTAVRFAWGSADVPNLMARGGLPAAQFHIALP